MPAEKTPTVFEDDVEPEGSPAGDEIEDPAAEDQEIYDRRKSRVDELGVKGDLTDDEKNELKSLKKGLKTQDRMRRYYHGMKNANARAAELELRVRALEGSSGGQGDQAPAAPSLRENEMMEIGGKKYYTDAALRALIKAGRMTSDEAFDHQQARIEERLEERISKRAEERMKNVEEARIRQEDAEAAMRRYPRFNRDHPDFDPNDPQYLKAMHFWQKGFRHNPRGLTESLDAMEEAMGLKKKRPDLSEDLNVGLPGQAPSRRSSPGEKEVELSEDEKGIAIRTFTMGDVLNPKTGRPYTESEALEKAKRAKNARLERHREARR
jgi:hypothetical protein